MPNNSQRPVLRIDPFFDGENGMVHSVAMPQYADMAGRQPTLAPTAPRQASPNVYGSTTAASNSTVGYHDVRDVVLDNGRPMSAVMRGGPSGLGGTVIPRAGLGGVPHGVRLHEPSQLEVNIDPHIEGARSRLRLADVVPNLRAAQQMAAEATPEPYDIATLRLRSAAVMHGVAQLANAQRENNGQTPYAYQEAPPTSPGNPYGNIPAPNQAQWAGQGASPYNGGGMYQPPPQHTVQQQLPQRMSRPLQAFTQQPQMQMHEPPAREMRPIDLSASPMPVERRRNPEMEVTFEIEHFGTHVASYHDVLVQDGFLVLVHDTSYAGRMYAPPANPDAPPMAVAITGHNMVYLVHSTGIRYVYGNHEFCVLLVEQESTVPTPA